jgi:hypothetical protein
VRTWRIPAIGLAVGLLSAAVSFGQATSPYAPAPATPTLGQALTPPPYKYAVNPQSGDWLVCVQTFKEARFANGSIDADRARALAEEFAEYIQRKYKVSAFLYERGFKDRMEEAKRVQEIRDRHWAAIQDLKDKKLDPLTDTLRYKTTRYPFEYAVLVGKKNRNMKEMEDARKFLDDIHGWEPPPETFSNAIVPDAQTSRAAGYAYINPFKLAMVVHNPTVEIVREKGMSEEDRKLMRALNADEPYSALRCSKPYTLMVKLYQGHAVLVKQGPTGGSRVFGSRGGESLGAAGAQAHATAEFLRKMKPSFEAYVLHCHQCSFVTVGQYDRLDDPNFLANQKTLAGLQLKAGLTVVETLNAEPLAMQIPK